MFTLLEFTLLVFGECIKTIINQQKSRHKLLRDGFFL